MHERDSVGFHKNGFNPNVGLTIIGIDNPDIKTPAVVIVVVVIDHQVQSSINLSGKCRLTADQERLCRLAVRWNYEPDECTYSCRR